MGSSSELTPSTEAPTNALYPALEKAPRCGTLALLSHERRSLLHSAPERPRLAVAGSCGAKQFAIMQKVVGRAD
jgi:hypothetical protein